MDGLYEQVRIAIHQVWRRRWLALAVAWGICVLGWLAVALIPNTYESKSRVFVQAQSILPNQVGITVQEREGDLNRVKQTLTSSENLAKVVRRTDLNSLVASERDLAVQVAGLRESIKVTAQPDNMFEISATAKVSGFSNRQNAKLSAAIVQGLLDLFVEQNLAGDRARLIRHDRATGSQTEYDLKIARLLKKGDTKANVRLEPGDVIIIPESMF